MNKRVVARWEHRPQPGRFSSRVRMGRFSTSCTSSTWAITWGMRAGSERGANSTNLRPSAKAAEARAADIRASRVLPLPPGPVRVTRREEASKRPTSAGSRWRPMKLLNWRGRLGTSVSTNPDSCTRSASCSRFSTPNFP